MQHTLTRQPTPLTQFSVVWALSPWELSFHLCDDFILKQGGDCVQATDGFAERGWGSYAAQVASSNLNNAEINIRHGGSHCPPAPRMRKARTRQRVILCDQRGCANPKSRQYKSKY